MRLFFATDIHGSETCWRKFLNSGPHYDADVVILGGDMTGKALVPIIDDGGGRWHATLLENREELEGEDAVREFEQAVIRRGYYPFRTTPDEVRELAEDEPRWHALFEEQMLKTVELGEGRVVDVNGFQLASSGWANRTPWDTYREEDEPVLAQRIARVTDQLSAPPEKTIFSLHCPPYGTGLDDAPELTEEMDLRNAGHSTIPAGSTAVREAIEELQPALSLHGHIHEARGSTRLGRTLCINPGSSYEQGQLLGAVVDLDGKKKVKRFVLTSG